MKLHSLAKATVLAMALVGSSAMADTILAFAQANTGSPMVGTRTGSSTTITATDVFVRITGFGDPSVVTPVGAYFDLSLASTSGAVLIAGQIIQTYSGTFSFNSAADNTGLNYLSGSFTNAAFGGAAGSGLTITGSEPGNTVSFTTPYVMPLGSPRAFSLSFADVAPPLAIVNGTLASFTASVTGTASANRVPEPATLGLIGAALLGLAATRRRATV